MDRLEKLVENGFRKLERSVQSVHDDVAKLKVKEGERSGTWKAIAAFAASVGTAVGLFIQYIMHLGGK